MTDKLTPSKPMSTGHSSSDSEITSLSTESIPTSNAKTISNESESNRAYGLRQIFDKIKNLNSIYKLDFSDRIAISDFLYEAWQCGFKDRSDINIK